MKDKKTVPEFSRGVLDRIREYCIKKFPENWKEYVEIDEEITGRIVGKGDRMTYTRKINKQHPKEKI